MFFFAYHNIPNNLSNDIQFRYIPVRLQMYLSRTTGCNPVGLDVVTQVDRIALYDDIIDAAVKVDVGDALERMLLGISAKEEGLKRLDHGHRNGFAAIRHVFAVNHETALSSVATGIDGVPLAIVVRPRRVPRFCSRTQIILK